MMHYFFTEFIPVLSQEIPVLNLLMKFCTAHVEVPPLGLASKISVLYGNSEMTMPDSDACFNNLKIPIKYTDASEFHYIMVTTLRHASCSFTAFR